MMIKTFKFKSYEYAEAYGRGAEWADQSITHHATVPLPGGEFLGVFEDRSFDGPDWLTHDLIRLIEGYGKETGNIHLLRLLSKVSRDNLDEKRGQNVFHADAPEVEFEVFL